MTPTGKRPADLDALLKGIAAEPLWGTFRMLGRIADLRESGDVEGADAWLRFLISYIAYRLPTRQLAHVLAETVASSSSPEDLRLRAMTLRALGRKPEAEALTQDLAPTELELELGPLITNKLARPGGLTPEEREELHRIVLKRK